MIRYEYAAIPVVTVIGLCYDPVSGHSDAYASDDKELRGYRELLSAGFRWVRIENGMAIFEREVRVKKTTRSRAKRAAV